MITVIAGPDPATRVFLAGMTGSSPVMTAIIQSMCSSSLPLNQHSFKLL
jgi:hypothetical protein